MWDTLGMPRPWYCFANIKTTSSTEIQLPSQPSVGSIEIGGDIVAHHCTGKGGGANISKFYIKANCPTSRIVGLHIIMLVFSQEWSMSNFSCSITRNITSHSIKNLASHHLLRWKMIILPILTTSLMHFSFEGLGECTFLTWEWKG